MNIDTKVTTAGILVGGQGTRLQSVVKQLPKPLAPIVDAPFLDLIFQQLAEIEIQDVVLLCGYKNEAVVSFVENSAYPFNIHISTETTPLGTAGALALAKPYFRGNDRFLVMNGDSILWSGLGALIKGLEAADPKVEYITSLHVQNADRYGTLDLQAQRVVAFKEKLKGIGQGYINAGIYAFSQKIFSHIPPGQPCSLENDVLPQLATDNKLSAITVKSEFIDIGIPIDYARCIMRVLSKSPIAGEHDRYLLQSIDEAIINDLSVCRTIVEKLSHTELYSKTPALRNSLTILQNHLFEGTT